MARQHAQEEGTNLRQDGDGGPELFESDSCDVDAVELDGARVQLDDPKQQLHQSRFARPGPADLRHALQT